VRSTYATRRDHVNADAMSQMHGRRYSSCTPAAAGHDVCQIRQIDLDHVLPRGHVFDL
jgi:hypothetical protein